MLPDFRLALRQLAKSPGFAAVAVVTLALGIGANTSMFSVFNEFVLRPLPYADSYGLDRLYRRTAQNPRGNIAPADYLAARTALSTYGELATYGIADLSLAEPGRPPEMANGIRVSANFLSLLGRPPVLGRDFRPAEVQLGNNHVVIISQRYWRNRFGADPGVIGRTIRLDGEPHEIVGVLPATFEDSRHLGWVDVLRPLGLSPAEMADHGSPILRLLGRRDPRLTAAQGQAIVANFGRHLAAEFPAANLATSWRTVPLNDTLIDEDGPLTMALLIGLSGLVLLIACSNLANLLLARTMARAREFAVRAALGATRAQLLRPLLAESLLLAFAGGGGAILVAVWSTDWLSGQSTTDDGISIVFTLDWHVLAWAFVACLGTAVTFGVAPALFATRLDVNHSLKSGSRSVTAGRGQQRFRSFLIVTQFALATVLLAGAALFVRGLHDLNHRRIGWDSAQLVTGNFLLPAATYPDDSAITAFQQRAVERLEALPGVVAASVASAMPYAGLSETRRFLVAGRPAPAPGREPAAGINAISPHYFPTVGTRLLQGRAFADADTGASAKVYLINESMARGLFGDASPLGHRLMPVDGNADQAGEIVGVVADTKSASPDPSQAAYQVYRPMPQEARRANIVAVRTAGIAPSSVVESIRAAMAALDPDLPVLRLQPADFAITRQNYQLGVLGRILSALAALGLSLASLGVYGVMARTMAQRTNEFGIRVALGAQIADITRLVLASGVKLALLGSGLGLVGAVGVARLITAGFPGIHAQSPLVLAGVTVLLILVALLACWLPARRAARVDPITALRAE